MANPVPLPTNAFPGVNLIPTLSTLIYFVMSLDARLNLPNDDGRANFSQYNVSFLFFLNNFLREECFLYFILCLTRMFSLCSLFKILYYP